MEATTSIACSRRSTPALLRSLSLSSSSLSTGLQQRSSSSLKRLNSYGHSSSSCSQSVRFSPNRSISSGQKRTCLCSPTTHPGSFRCALHRRSSRSDRNETLTSKTTTNRSYSCTNSGLNLRRSAIVNSLARIGVKVELVKRSSTALIRPSSQHIHRRADFKPRPSRFSAMSSDQG